MTQLQEKGSLSHAYVGGSFVAMCGYVRGAREPMNASKPRCPECITQEMPEGLQGGGSYEGNVQTLIDECVDGTWDATLMIGSNVVWHGNAETFGDAARLLDDKIQDEGTYR